MHPTYTDTPRRNETRDPGLRAADRDRDAVAEALREHHLAGRLDTDEFQKRLDLCYAATTYGELGALVADLPPEEQPSLVRRPVRWWVVVLVGLLIAAIALSQGHLLWLAIPLFLFVGRPLLWRYSGRRRGWGLSGCGVGPAAPRGTEL